MSTPTAQSPTTLDPQAAAYLAATADAATVATMTVPQARIALMGYLELQLHLPDVMAVQHRFIPGPTADLPIRIIRPRPATEPQPAVVLLHGSGWVACNLDVIEEPARRLALDTGFVVVTVNYQKAPEHPFPIPLDDSVAGIRWVLDHAIELGIDPERVAVAGDSAGGNLAAAATTQLAAEGTPIAAQALLYPALDRRQDADSYREFGSGYGLGAADMAWFWGHYAAAELADDPRVSPLRSAESAALPATFVATAGHDVLREEGEEYARLLSARGIPVLAKRYPGMIHGFWLMDAALDQSRTLQRDLADFLVARLAERSR